MNYDIFTSNKTMHHLSSCDDQEKNICDNECFGKAVSVYNNAPKKSGFNKNKKLRPRLLLRRNHI